LARPLPARNLRSRSIAMMIQINATFPAMKGY